MRQHRRQLPIARTDDEFEAILKNAQSYYVPFPPFSDWPSLSPRQGRIWDDARNGPAAARRSASPPVIQELSEALLREAANNTGALEGLYDVDRGFTQSVANEQAAWMSIGSIKGRPVEEMIHAQRAAFDQVLDVATGSTPLTESLLRQLHEQVCRTQENYEAQTPTGPQEHRLPRGEYKRTHNYPRKPNGEVFVYAPPEATASEMGRLIAEVATPEFVAAHPAVQAAYGHYAFVTIHPFADGNGRVARLLASIFLLRALSIPLVIWRDQRSTYLDALSAADTGSLQEFYRFVFDRAVNAANDLSLRIKTTASDQTLQAAEERVELLLRGQTGLAHAEIQAIGARIFEASIAAIESARASVALPAEVYWESAAQSGVSRQREGYRALDPRANEVWGVALRCNQPVGVALPLTILPYVANAPESSFDFVIDAVRNEPLELGVRVSEVYPALSEAFERRVRRWAKQAVATLAYDFSTELQSTLRRAGF
jgi:Fic family protein